MPIYEYECDQCGRRHDEFMTLAERESGAAVACPECGAPMRKMFSTFVAHGLDTGSCGSRVSSGYDIQLGCYVSDDAQRREIAKRRGFTEREPEAFEAKGCSELKYAKKTRGEEARAAKKEITANARAGIQKRQAEIMTKTMGTPDPAAVLAQP